MPVLFVLVVPFEKLFPSHPGQRIPRLGWRTDIGWALAAPALTVLTVTFAIAISLVTFARLPGMLLRPLVAMIPEVALPFPTFTGALVVIQIFLGLFLHANVRWRMRPLHRLFVTPEFHHWHHANEQAAHHMNYSIFLPIWDTVFGTYRMPKVQRPMVYGLDEPMAPTIAGQLWWPFAHIERPVRKVLSGFIHPIRSARLLLRTARMVVAGIWTSIRRPTHSARPMID